MCDTFVTIGSDGVLFAKNSDRDVNEAQCLEWVPAARHDAEGPLRCTWIEVAQVARTNAVLLSRPWWMWGAEMGANEHGVVIGNEAVFTNQRDGEPALLGMDLLRLGLERGSNAREAVQVMVELLERYGQGGPCSHENPGFTYDNSFLVADRDGAVVLETAGRHWATEEVANGVRGISNGLTIDRFAEEYSNRIRTSVAGARTRRARTERGATGALGPGAMMSVLRDHGPGTAPWWSLLNGTLHAPCVHGGGLAASSQTTASLVADLRSDPIHWVTATSAPCTSFFKPVRVHEPLDLGPLPTDTYDPATLWWRHERLHRIMLRDFDLLHPDFARRRDECEVSWLASPPPSHEAFESARRIEEDWLDHVAAGQVDRRPLFVRRQWRHWNQVAKLP